MNRDIQTGVIVLLQSFLMSRYVPYDFRIIQLNDIEIYTFRSVMIILK